MCLILPSSTFYHSNGLQFEVSHLYLVLDVILSGIRTSAPLAFCSSCADHASSTILSHKNHEARVRAPHAPGMFPSRIIGPLAPLNFSTFQRLAYLMTAVWKSAIPPTLCAILMCTLYVQFAVAQQVCSRHHSFIASLFISINA